MKQYSVLGKSVPRVDAWDKVTGQAKYSVDIDLPGTLFGKILRSPLAPLRTWWSVTVSLIL